MFALCLLSLIWFNPLTKDLNSKSNARQIAEAIGYRPVHAGDAVISTEPETGACFDATTLAGNDAITHQLAR